MSLTPAADPNKFHFFSRSSNWPRSSISREATPKPSRYAYVLASVFPYMQSLKQFCSKITPAPPPSSRGCQGGIVIGNSAFKTPPYAYVLIVIFSVRRFWRWWGHHFWSVGGFRIWSVGGFRYCVYSLRPRKTLPYAYVLSLVFSQNQNVQQILTIWQCRPACIERVLVGNRNRQSSLRNTAICLWFWCCKHKKSLPPKETCHDKAPILGSGKGFRIWICWWKYWFLFFRSSKQSHMAVFSRLNFL